MTPTIDLLRSHRSIRHFTDVDISDAQREQYYLTRGSNTRRDTWSDHIRRTIIKESRPFILEYLHKQGWATR